MDRQTVYLTETPRSADILQLQQSTLEALGFAVGDIIGTGTKVTGLPCTPTAPPGLTVNVGAGRIYQTESLEQTAWGELGTPPPGQSGVGGLPVNTEQVTKQGIIRTTTNFSCPAPTITGDSINYLIEAQYQDSDENATNLFFYNANNPASPITNTLTTTRAGLCALRLKAGTAAPTGTQVTPTPDAGWTGVWVVTVAFGQTQITATSIAIYAPSPFLPVAVGQEIFYCQDSGAVNAYVVSPTPFNGMPPAGTMIILNTSNANTQASTLNATGAPVSIFHNSSANLLRFGDVVAGKNILISDGTNWCTLNAGPTLLSTGITLNVTTSGNDSTGDGLTVATAFATLQHAYNIAISLYNANGNNITIQMGNGTYSVNSTGAVLVAAGPTSGQVIVQGNSGNQSSVVLQNTSTGIGSVVEIAAGVLLGVQNLTLDLAGATGTSQSWAFANGSGANLTLNNVTFTGGNSATAGINIGIGSECLLEGSCTLNTSATLVSMFSSLDGGNIQFNGLTFTVSGGPTFTSGFAIANVLSLILVNVSGATFSGSATGPRYSGALNSVIFTAGGGASFFPGSSAGVLATGGQYA